ncbi:uncharacterized protein CIMG_12551 [Coccidioides immitis RS]|uniref:Uncharacterized protein n=1 Tax=Coccidioides immitis (strain RS) TaxID=246410 RepID=A0A0D8JRE5_COCIM|nr:uncharacterized protein CIMG_12551 [Coccidioides immitis RS]KJF59920.1 hypothetical protein CIMG_12551 [Coccidioides immitis RS]
MANRDIASRCSGGWCLALASYLSKKKLPCSQFLFMVMSIDPNQYVYLPMRKSQEKLTEERTRNGDMFTTPNAGLFSVDASFMIRASDASRADSPRPERLGSGAEQADVNIKHR